MPEKTAQKEPGKKPVPSKKPKPQQEVVVQISLSELHPFPDHPFQVREDASMQETAESVKEYGVLVPALARPREDGGYELIAGHRRKHACELAGLATMPVIVRDIDRDAATIIMVDSNLQRENILPSERAKAYKMKMEAIKRQGARTDLTSPKISAKFRSDDEVGQDAGVSGDTIRNYIALTQLVPELQQMVDEKKIALSPAYQLAALTPKEQGLLLETIDSEQTTPSLSQAQRMFRASYSILQDELFHFMTEQGFKGFQRGEYGSTAEHLTSLQYQIQQDKERLEKLQKRIQKEQVKYEPARHISKTLNEIDSMGQKTFTGKMAISQKDYSELTALAKEGITSRAEIKKFEQSANFYRQKYMDSANALERMKTKYNELKEKCRPFLEALEHFPEVAKLFTEKVKQLFSFKEAQEQAEKEAREKERQERIKARRNKRGMER